MTSVRNILFSALFFLTVLANPIVSNASDPVSSPSDIKLAVATTSVPCEVSSWLMRTSVRASALVLDDAASEGHLPGGGRHRTHLGAEVVPVG